MDDDDIERAGIIQFDGHQSPEVADKLAAVLGKPLRQYQIDGIAALRESLRAGHKRVIYYSPTGSGKTEVSRSICQAAIAKGKRVAFVCNRIELVSQTSVRFNADYLYHGILQGANTRGEWNSLMICSIQTISNRSLGEFDMLIIDEAHACAGSKAYRDLFTRFKDVPIIGLTATPFSKGLAKHYDALGGPLFQDVVVGATIPDLIRDGFLVDVDIYGPSEPDLSAVRITAGDYNQEDLAAAVDTDPLVGDIVTHWQRLGENQQTICFATNVAHSKHIVAEFTKAGISAMHIDGYMDDIERKPIIRDFRASKFKVLSNCSVLAEGFDCPDVAVMILARPTKSLVRYIQMAGRVLRPAPGKDRARMLDHSGTAKRLGFPTDDLPLVLDDGKPNSSSATRKVKETPLPKPCPKCHFLKPARTHACPKCNFAPERQSEVETVAGNLVPLRRIKSKTQPADAARWFGQLKYIAQERGYSAGWAAHKFREKFDTWPNAYKDAAPTYPGPDVTAWVKSRQIAYAKRRKVA